MPMLINLVRAIIDLLIILVIVRAVMSWFNPDPRNTVVEFIRRLTDPMMRPVQNVLGVQGGIDFSPIVVILILSVLERLLIRLAVGL